MGVEGMSAGRSYSRQGRRINARMHLVNFVSPGTDVELFFLK